MTIWRYTMLERGPSLARAVYRYPSEARRIVRDPQAVGPVAQIFRSLAQIQNLCNNQHILCLFAQGQCVQFSGGPPRLRGQVMQAGYATRVVEK